MKKTISIIISIMMFLYSLPLNAVDFAIMDKDYFISAGDVVNIEVYPASEFSKEVTVQPDGTIEIPLLGSIKVSGMRVSELEKLLVSKFAKYVSSPSVTINIRKFSAYKVGIIGQIQRSGYYDYYEGMKLMDLITSAGGFADYANSEKVRVFRKTKNEKGEIAENSFELNLGDLLRGKIEKNIVLAPGDIVYVPRQKFTSAGKWITDNLLPWTMLFTFGLTIGIISRK
jgi:polysaccharide export outer membrane protein